ncbi:putative permease, major facilitator superfamily [Acidithiobacillus caldus ATCC 51756]|nr:putative permease, major facilitator superfamily [Acidithiobacillus caldus ATCC 51756]
MALPSWGMFPASGGNIMEIKEQAEYSSPYRWVMAAVAGIIMTTSFMSLTAFGVAAPAMAKAMDIPPSTLSTAGIDAFSVGLFVAFFLGHGGIFDTRIKLGVLLAQAFLIVPQILLPLLMPLTKSLTLLIALRFCQGLMIMMIALFSLQLAGWFRSSQRGISLAAMLGAITLGGAVGGIVTGSLSRLGWQNVYYITAGIMVLGAVVYFLFARDAAGHAADIQLSKQNSHHKSVWSYPMTWIMGIVQIPNNWTLFTIGGFLPLYAYHLGYQPQQTGNVMFIWGLMGFLIAILGALLGDHWARQDNSHRNFVNARLRVITLANTSVIVGALMILYLAPISYAWFLVSALVVACTMATPPNYWASPCNCFAVASMGAGAFAIGVISNSVSAVGPVASSVLIDTVGWSGVFWVMAILAALGLMVNEIAMRASLPIETEANRQTEPHGDMGAALG